MPDNPNGELQVDHFMLNTHTYMSLRRYLGTRPFDEVRQIVGAFDEMPAVTSADIAAREQAAEHRAYLEKKCSALEEDIEQMKAVGEAMDSKEVPTDARQTGPVEGDNCEKLEN